VIKNNKTGEIQELRCEYDPSTRGGSPKDGRKVKGTIHWVSAEHAVRAEVRLYDRLFIERNPDQADKVGESNYLAQLNTQSLEILSSSCVEPGLKEARPGDTFQFERQGYFCVDSYKSDHLVFNRTVSLRDSWAKVEKTLEKKRS